MCLRSCFRLVLSDFFIWLEVVIMWLVFGFGVDKFWCLGVFFISSVVLLLVVLKLLMRMW